MIAVWLTWMICSSLHYAYLSATMSQAFESILSFSLIQTSCAGVLSFIVHDWRFQNHRRQASTDSKVFSQRSSCKAKNFVGARRKLVLAGVSFALATILTNYSVKHGSLSSSRMLKSLEPAIVAAFQTWAGMNAQKETPWIYLMAYALVLMLIASPRGLTLTSAFAALTSSVGISCRNVLMKMLMLEDRDGHMLVGGEHSAQPNTWMDHSAHQMQTSVNFVACAFTCLALGAFILWKRVPLVALDPKISTIAIACASLSFAVFQISAFYVLENVSPTQQSALKALQTTVTTAMAVLIDSEFQSYSLLQILPAIIWAVCTVALSLNVSVDIASGFSGWDAVRGWWRTAWHVIFFVCAFAALIQSMVMCHLLGKDMLAPDV